MENNEKIIESVTGEQERVDLDINVVNTCGIAIIGAAKQLADKNLYYVGLGAGLLFGKKAGLKTMGAIIGVGAIYNAAKFVSGEFHNKE